MSIYKNKFQGEMNMIFKHMSLKEAKEIYKKLKQEEPSAIVKNAMEDIWFFTDGLQKDYGGMVENDKV